MQFQQKILRVMEYQQFERVGGTKTLKVDVRIIAATNSELERLMQGGKFREDLYDRLAFETIWMPPLRERKGDIELLAYHFMERMASEIAGIQPKKISQEALELLVDYDWPGNVRELKYVIERVTYKTDEAKTILPHHLPQEIRSKGAGETGNTLEERIAKAEKESLLNALVQHNWDEKAAADELAPRDIRLLL